LDKIKIDDIEYNIDKNDINLNNLTIFQFCYNKGITIPCFCYHEKLSIAGNCRICLVQINNNLGVSCSINIADNMFIYTNNKRVNEARESVLEFLLINHPLDCPICDQGGECDLQDISLIFGSDRGRFYEMKKRAVDNFSQNGPLIKTLMTRCIHCTRCVRFANEVSDFTLGILNRGQSMEIGTYYNLNLLDELSGNIIDLCPVGALTSMPYAFRARPWELNFYSNIDFLDSLAASIRLYIYSNKIIRVIPLLNESLNEEWITNKTRFSYDSLLINRNFYPKLNLYEKFVVFSWDFVIHFLFYNINKYIFKYNDINCIIGNFIDLYSALSIKSFFNTFGCNNIIFNIKFNFIYDFNYLFTLNKSLQQLEYINFYLFISCDMRLESPLLNIRLKKNYNINRNSELFFFSYGISLNYLTYPVRNLGNSIYKFLLFLQGKQRFFSDYYLKDFNTFSYINYINYSFYSKPIFFLGNSIYQKFEFKNIILSFVNLFKNKFDWSSLNCINSYLGYFSYLNILYKNYYNFKNNFKGFLYLISNESNNLLNINKEKIFIVYQGFIKKFNENINLILPTAAPYEMDCLFINLEGNYRILKKILKSDLNSYSDWELISLLNLYNKKNNNLIYYNYIYFLKIIKYFMNILNYFCNFFLSLNKFYIEFYYFTGFFFKLNKNNISFYKLILFFKLKFINSIFNTFINNYYSTDFYLKNSKIMSFSSLFKNKIFKL
jgi:NADH-quinone oxidoreductase chain G